MLSAEDPGVENWIDTSGLSQGLIALRLQGKETNFTEEELEYPKLDVVPFATVKDVKDKLPADTPNYDNAERIMQLRLRQAHVRRRYIIW